MERQRRGGETHWGVGARKRVFVAAPFARTEGQKGGEFYTPASIVKLLTEVIEPFHGRILDPACGSGGMFVQSARFVAEHQKNPADELAICGVEKTDETGRLCRLNLAVHGLEGDIRHGGNVNSYYDDPHAATGDPEVLLEGGVVGVFFGGLRSSARLISSMLVVLTSPVQAATGCSAACRSCPHRAIWLDTD